MARKITDSYPVVKVTPQCYGDWTVEEAHRAGDDLIALIKAHIVPHVGQIGSYCKGVDLDIECISEAQCEHCRSPWTEDGADYNGGCCGKDEANNPERLKEMADAAEAVSDGSFYRFDADRGRERVPVNWPDQFGCAVANWLDRGRPSEDVPRLLDLAKRVQASEWCTVESDPGPPGCSLPRQEDRVIRDERPEALAQELLSLLDDMDLLPATQEAA